MAGKKKPATLAGVHGHQKGNPMIIPLSDECRIRGTEQCWQLEFSKQSKGGCEWRAKKYFTTLDNALREAAWREIRLYPAETLADAISAVDEVAARYSRLTDDALASVREDAKKLRIAS